MTDPQQRASLLSLVDEAVSSGAGREKACQLIGLAPSTLRRWRPVKEAAVTEDQRPTAIRPAPSNRYTCEERKTILDVCNSARFASMAPSQIVPTLADEGRFIGSESTIYRVLKAEGQLTHRGRSKARSPQSAPSTHIATAPNQVWMADVTWLPSRVRGQFYYLYMVEDLYSRFGVSWEVFESESADFTRSVIDRAKCVMSPPVLHTDNGSVFKAQTVAQKLYDLGIKPSHSRPRVSNDNAYIESMFRSLKYCPSWPSQGFESLSAARDWVERFMRWYNHEHKHSGIRFVTPAQRHSGEDIAILANRQKVYERAKAARPDRWRGKTRNWKHIASVALNPDRVTDLKS